VSANGDPVGYFIEPDVTPNTTRICGEWRGDSTIILMQFTGLKDKNGKEIYEGDIVHVWSEYKHGLSEHGNWEVFWRIDRWHLRRGDESWDNGDYYQGDDVSWNEPDGSSKMEVIGNVYKHPDLLKSVKQ
jgi:uncharacterized phage protein (TIGR01671 family)